MLVLARKPGELRNGVPSRMPAALERVRRKLDGSNDGDRQMVKSAPPCSLDSD